MPAPPGPRKRATCPLCRESVTVRDDGLIYTHGPEMARCEALWLEGPPVIQHPKDIAARRTPPSLDRPVGSPSVDERVRNGAMVANTAAGNWTNHARLAEGAS